MCWIMRLIGHSSSGSPPRHPTSTKTIGEAMALETRASRPGSIQFKLYGSTAK